MFDVTDRRAFEDLAPYVVQMRRYTSDEPGAYTAAMLLGTKTDLGTGGHDMVTRLEAETFAAANGLLYAECSSKTGACASLLQMACTPLHCTSGRGRWAALPAASALASSPPPRFTARVPASRPRCM